VQVRDLGLEGKRDKEIWEFARSEGFVIVTFDSDFYDMVTLYGHPPKIIWLRMGNTSSQNLVSILVSGPPTTYCP
jgi:predicted nuclease of predicted toxin-antitoxin system